VIIPVRAVVAILLRPALWTTAIAAVLRMSQPQWWKRFPPVPSIPADYAAFRSVTASGGDGSVINPDDLMAWLKWCRVNQGHLR
jgi:hypothetical protein